MRIWTGRLLLIAALVGAVQLTTVAAARACDIKDPLYLTLDYLVSPDLNNPESQFAADFAEYWNGTPLPQVLGAYATETVHTVEPVDEWTRGSISIITHSWGDAPEDTGPFLVETVNLAEFESSAPNGSCEPDTPSDGPVLGSRAYHIVYDDEPDPFTLLLDDASAEELDAVFAVVFGEPINVARDEGAVQILIAELEVARRAGSGSPVAVAVAFGGVLVLAGVASYRSKERRAVAQFRHNKAQAQAAEEFDDTDRDQT